MLTRADALAEIFPGDSVMSRAMREKDWAATSLGDPLSWPDGLKIPLKMLLTSRFEMWLGWGPDLNFFYNDAYIPTLGIKHPAMLGHPFREVWSEVYAEVEDQVARVRAGESTWNKALLLLLERSGYPEETYHSFSYSPLFGADGAVEGLLCVVSEETERVISERRLATLRTLGTDLVGALDYEAIRRAVSAAIDSNPRDFPFAIVFLGAPRGTHVFASSNAAHLIDYPWESELEPLGDGRLVKLRAGRAYPAGAWDREPSEALVVPLPSPGGDSPSGAVLFGLNPYRRKDDDLSGVARLMAAQIAGALENVATLTTERRRADRIWSHSRDLIVVADQAGYFRSVSPAWTDILGHDVEHVVGRHFSEFILEEDIPASTSAQAQAGSGKKLTDFENRFKTSDGGFRWISWHTAAEDGLVYSYGRDVTRQKNDGAALQQAEDALRQAQKMEAVGQLTGGIAHDFNNLLTGIIGSLEIVQRRVSQGRYEDIARFAEAATVSANRAAALTQRLLAFSRRQSLDPKLVDANRLVRGMEDLIRRSIGERIQLEADAQPGLWLTKCDPNQLESALLNLVVNARDAMPDGGRLSLRTRNVSIERRGRALVSAGDYVALEVVDTGTGMPESVREKAFDPFFTTKPLGEGTGLGLSMVYGFARQSGGGVVIESAEGKGTTVRILLPRSEETEIAADAPPAPREEAAKPRGECTVLVVEDEAIVRSLIVDLIEEIGCKVIEESDGARALEILRSGRKVDLLLTDVGLPGLNGRQLADAGRALRPDLKILFLTGYAHEAAMGKSLIGPGMELITKPFNADSLTHRIRALTEM